MPPSVRGMDPRTLTRQLAAVLLALGIVTSGLGACPATTAEAVASPAARSVEPTPEAIDAYLDDLYETTGVPGLSAVVTHGDEVVHAAGYGHTSDGAPVTADTPMRIASVSKSFTSMAVTLLAEDGKIDLDGAVTDQLPSLKMADPRVQDVTVRQLLTQTSGFSDTTIDVADLAEATSGSDYLVRLGDDTLAADPGTTFAYCNVNFDVAARLVEEASGRPFDVFMTERVFGPLGMARSALREEDVTPADGYNSVLGWWVPREEPAWFDGSGSGGVITSAADLSSWLISQNGQGTQLVSGGGLEAMHTRSAVGDYGHGWYVEDDGTRWHSGFVMTYRAVEWIDPSTGYGIAVLTNGAGLLDVTNTALAGLVALTRGKTPEAPADARAVDLALVGLLVASLAIGVTGVVRARGWAARRVGRPVWSTGLRLVWLGLPATAFLLLPTLASLLTGGRTFPWSSLVYFALPLTLTLLAAGLAGLVVAGARLVRLARRRSVGSTA